jgi:peptidylprolyl isomerase
VESGRSLPAAIVHVPALMIADRMWPFLLALLLGAAPTTGWRVPDPNRLLVIDTNQGRIVIEMEPRVGPQAVERVALLARRGTYDGLLFHRVIAKFVAQTGNPNNRDGGGTELPDLKREVWISKPASEAITWVRMTNDGREGVIGSLPVAKGADPVMPAWVPQCGGMVGMGRQPDPNSANSEIYIMLGSARGLDHDYTVFGRVLAGQSVVDALAVGEPPANPDRMIRVRSAVDLPAADRPRLEVMDVTSREYARFAAAKRHALGTQLSICDMLPPVRSLT